jgi:hypothetical protein
MRITTDDREPIVREISTTCNQRLCTHNLIQHHYYLYHNKKINHYDLDL